MQKIFGKKPAVIDAQPQMPAGVSMMLKSLGIDAGQFMSAAGDIIGFKETVEAQLKTLETLARNQNAMLHAFIMAQPDDVRERYAAELTKLLTNSGAVIPAATSDKA